MRILVTGGAGYIGSVFVRELLKKGYEVVVVDTFFFGEDSLKDIKDRIKIIKKDIREVSREDVRGSDVVIDFAALSNDPAAELDSKLTYSINHLGRASMARISKEVGVSRYIAPSSCAIYGVSDGFANEKSEANPLTAYAKANRQWERDILPMADNRFCVTVLRQSTVYGLSYKMRFDLLVNNFALQVFKDKKIKIKGDGNEFRPFVHVKDDCDAFLKIIECEKEKINGEIFNVGSNEQNVRIGDLLEMTPEVLKVDCEKEFGEWVDKRNYKVSFDKIAKTLGFKTKYNVQDGIKEVYNALEEGIIDGDDPRTVTVSWYKNLIGKGVLK